MNVKRGSLADWFSVTSEAPWLLVFDLDGTLINSSRDLCAAVNAALEHIERPVLEQDVITSFIGDGAAMLLRRALRTADAGLPDSGTARDDFLFEEAFRFFLLFYREHKLDTTHVYPGVLESLHSIRDTNPKLPMAVLTNKPVRPSREICAALGLSPFFFANYGGDSFATKKPDGEGLLQIAAEARALQRTQGLSPEGKENSGVVVIGDSPTDVLTARACGARVIGCRYGLDPEALTLSRPDVLVESAFSWPGVLGL